ncbi:MAG TPA: GNAT family N-acetyltransferase [Firmicutes bacterium]|nr:GNAT family N-acetyltransferase [Candidatus Fermentithermobacillaceae bacterium]
MRLNTERLEVRPFELSDVEDAYLYLSDPLVMKFVELPFDLEKTRDFIMAHGMTAEPRVYALAERATGKLIGHVVFHRFEDDSVFELGWILSRSAWGRGYALEVSRALMDHAFRIMGLSKVVVEAVPDNVNAKKVIEKLGMRREGETAEGLELWSLSRSDYSRTMQE